jgi:hypothetical protein
MLVLEFKDTFDDCQFLEAPGAFMFYISGYRVSHEAGVRYDASGQTENLCWFQPEGGDRIEEDVSLYMADDCADILREAYAFDRICQVGFDD